MALFNDHAHAQKRFEIYQKIWLQKNLTSTTQDFDSHWQEILQKKESWNHKKLVPTSTSALEPHSTHNDLAAKIAILDELHTHSLISASEYSDKKRELLLHL